MAQQDHFSRHLQKVGCETATARGSSIKKKVLSSGGGETLCRLEGSCYYPGLFAPRHRQDGLEKHQEATKASMMYPPCPSFCGNTAWHPSFRDVYLSVKQFPAFIPIQQESISVSPAQCSLV